VYVFNTPNSIISIDNEQLLEAYTFEFTVGTGILTAPFPEGIPSGELEVSGVTLSGTVVLYTGAPEVYTVVSTDPLNMEPNVAVDISGIYVTFSGEITSTLAELSGLVTLDETPVLY
jgi:hypothetical protein